MGGRRHAIVIQGDTKTRLADGRICAGNLTDSLRLGVQVTSPARGLWRPVCPNLTRAGSLVRAFLCADLFRQLLQRLDRGIISALPLGTCPADRGKRPVA